MDLATSPPLIGLFVNEMSLKTSQKALLTFGTSQTIWTLKNLAINLMDLADSVHP